MIQIQTILGIFLLSLVLRIMAIDIPINLDEVSWIERGAEFWRQFLEGDWQDTYLRHHPGVPNLWLTGLGMFLNCQLRQHVPGLFDLAVESSVRECLKTETFPIGLFILPRLLQAIVTSLCMVAFYILSLRLLGRSIATMATILLVFEPFFLAYQRCLTPDALQADFTILGLLLYLLYLRGSPESDPPQRFHRLVLITSGVFMGLATAAKISAVFVFPGIVLWIVALELGWWQPHFHPKGWRQQSLDGVLWLGTQVLTLYAIWPVLWVEPIATLEKLYQGLQQESQRGFFFFLGQMTDAPNLLFYPIVLLYRLSPALLLGVAIAVYDRLLNRQTPQSASHRWELTAMAMVTVSILIWLCILNSKLDRYILPLVPLFAIAAAVGWQRVWQGLELPYGGIKALGGVVAAMQLMVFLPNFPYFLTYFNPLLGGSQVAQHLLMVGHGEGLDQAARWLNQSPNAGEMKVASGYSGAFAPYFQGETVKIGREMPKDAHQLDRWMQANRVVLYINQFQRRIPHPHFLAYFEAQTPLYQLQINGLDYVRVYPGFTPLPEDLQRIQQAKSMVWDKSYHVHQTPTSPKTTAIRLLGYDLNQPRFRPADRLVVSLYWKFAIPPLPDTQVEIALVDDTGVVVGRTTAPLVGGYLPLATQAPNSPVRDVQSLYLAPFLTPGRYTLQLAWVVSGKVQNQSRVTLGQVRIDRPEANPARSPKE